METIAKADIFFMITTVAVAVFAICIAVITFFVAQILRDIRDIVTTVRQEGERVIEDFDAVRVALKEKGIRFGDMFRNFTSVLRRGRSKKRNSDKI